MRFEWHEGKNTFNINKHGLSFVEAQEAFYDEKRIIRKDPKHSELEPRYFCIGKLPDGSVVTVRFTMREGNMRIIGAGFWRKGKKFYEKNN